MSLDAVRSDDCHVFLFRSAGVGALHREGVKSRAYRKVALWDRHRICNSSLAILEQSMREHSLLVHTNLRPQELLLLPSDKEIHRSSGVFVSIPELLDRQ